MAILPALTVFLGLSDVLNLNLGLQTPVFEFIQRAEIARIEDYPYQASVRINDRHYCGGSIISDTRILTAAHCVKDNPVKLISIRVGSDKHFEGKSYPVRDIVIHPIYNGTTLDSDIAFLTLARQLTFGTSVKPIELAASRSPDGSLAEVIGWGMVTEEPDVGTSKVATVRLVSQDSCRLLYPYDKITNRMVCADQGEFGRYPCHGDSGSPLVDKLTGKQIGVVSWGTCPERALPSVYASVPELIQLKEV